MTSVSVSDHAIDQMMPQPAEEVPCVVCGASRFDVLCSAQEIHAQYRYLMQFHKRRLLADQHGCVPESALTDRVDFTQNQIRRIAIYLIDSEIMSRTGREQMERADRMPAREGYDRWAPYYDDSDPSTLLDEPFLRSQCEPLAGLRVLDLGCGTGRYLRQLNLTGARVTAFDLSQAMLPRARRSMQDDASMMWVQGSAECLPFRPESFDRIISGLVVDQVVSLVQFFAGVADVLAPGGRAIISAIHPDMQRLTGPAVRFAVGKQECRIEGIVHEVADVLRAATNAGLSIITCEEPRVTEAIVERHPQWQSRLGCPALLLLACEKMAWSHRHEAN